MKMQSLRSPRISSLHIQDLIIRAFLDIASSFTTGIKSLAEKNKINFRQYWPYEHTTSAYQCCNATALMCAQLCPPRRSCC